MPGVPSGRGCDACRKQKKKCDQGKPSCSRCTRLGIECVGSGQRRFKFTEPAKFRNDANAAERSAVNATPIVKTRETSVISSPSSERSILMSEFVKSIEPSTDRRYNLLVTYGTFLCHVPSRLGINGALDASVVALTEAHANICNGRGVLPSALAKYSNALTQLRLTLDDPSKSCATETLCASMILGICQGLLGGHHQVGLSHSAGMARILKYRGRYYEPNDPFESELLLTLRGPVVFEAMWDESIEFTDAEWRQLVVNHLDNDGRPHGKIMLCMSRLPNFLRRKREWSDQEKQDAIITYQTAQLARSELWRRLFTVQGMISNGGPELGTWQNAEFDLARILALCGGMLIVTGCVVHRVNSLITGISEELHACAVEILSFSKLLIRYRPFGSSVMPMSLALAWIGTEDPEVRGSAVDLMKDYLRDFPGTLDDVALESHLAVLEKHCNLFECQYRL